jgi:2-oxoglutarate ferredoxin oxidoreductase subunit delta
MAKVIGEIIIDIEKCKGCELCVESCNKESIGISQTINLKGYQFAIKINDLCNGCGSCALVCPDAVISVYRQVNKEKKPVKVIELQD